VKSITMLGFGRSRLLILSAGLLLPACVVPQNRYDAANQKIRDEQTAHRETREKLRELEAVLARVQAALDAHASELTQKEKQLLRTKLESDVDATAREDAFALVEQLRGELARAGDHLRHYSEKKQELETALTEAEQRAKDMQDAERSFALSAQVVRNLTLALADRLGTGGATIEAEQQRLIVTVPSKDVFAPGKHQISAGAAALLGRIGAALEPLEGARVEVTEAPITVTDQPEDVIVKLQNVADALARGGMAQERIAVTLPPEASDPAESGDGPTEVKPAAAFATRGQPALRLGIAVR
jgi:flagellar motor protein MotB